MKRDRLESPLGRIGHAPVRVEAAGAGLRHNRAIKGACFLVPVPPLFEPRQHRYVLAFEGSGCGLAAGRFGVGPRAANEIRGGLWLHSIRRRSDLGEVGMMRPPFDTRKSVDAA